MADEVVISDSPCRPAVIATDGQQLHNTSQESDESVCYAHPVRPSVPRRCTFDVCGNLPRESEQCQHRHEEQTTIMLPSNHRHCPRSKKSKIVLRINYCLMFVCLSVVLIYVLTLLYLHRVFRWPALDSFRQALQSVGTESDFAFCIQKSMWTDADRFSLEKDFEYRMKRGSKGEMMVCFNSLDWIPVVIEKRSEQLLAKLPHDDDQVQNFTASAKRVSTNVATSFQPEGSSISSSGQESLLARLSHPLAHLCVSDNNQQAVLASAFVKWSAPDGEATYLKSVQLNVERDALKITRSGYYFVNSHLEFNSSITHGRIHCLHRVRRGTRQTLVRSSVLSKSGSMSLVQGVFELVENDTLSVGTQLNSVHLRPSTCISLFLI